MLHNSHLVPPQLVLFFGKMKNYMAKRRQAMNVVRMKEPSEPFNSHINSGSERGTDREIRVIRLPTYKEAENLESTSHTLRCCTRYSILSHQWDPLGVYHLQEPIGSGGNRNPEFCCRVRGAEKRSRPPRIRPVLVACFPFSAHRIWIPTVLQAQVQSQTPLRQLSQTRPGHSLSIHHRRFAASSICWTRIPRGISSIAVP